jgi:hypothetical protein
MCGIDWIALYHVFAFETKRDIDVQILAVPVAHGCVQELVWFCVSAALQLYSSGRILSTIWAEKPGH